ncbi:MAG: hypothetical protein ACQCXQ_03765 [Verrucomicrobiales bacterium]|nr:hypothetical protein [Verrucomicrobiota bacterium JB025]
MTQLLFPCRFFRVIVIDPITSLSADCEASDDCASLAGVHEILAVYFLFSSGNPVELDARPTHYSVRVDGCV